MFLVVNRQQKAEAQNPKQYEQANNLFKKVGSLIKAKSKNFNSGFLNSSFSYSSI